MTDTLTHIIENYVKDDKEADAIHHALSIALERYQWQYQNASDMQFRDVELTVNNTIKKAIELLTNMGYDQLADDVATVLENDRDLLIKSKFLSSAKKLMEHHAIKTIKVGRYKKEFAKKMGIAFIEHCKEYPLQYAPCHIEGEFEDNRKQAEYDDLQEFDPYR